MLGERWIVFHVMIYRGFADTSKKHIINKCNYLGFLKMCKCYMLRAEIQQMRCLGQSLQWFEGLAAGS